MSQIDPNIPDSIERFTTQLDSALYRKIQMLAAAAEVKNYILINKMLLLGAIQVLKDHKDRFKDTDVSFNTPDLKVLKDFLKEKGF